MATQKQLELRQKLLNKSIQPTTDPNEQKKNQQRMDTLKGVNSSLQSLAPSSQSNSQSTSPSPQQEISTVQPSSGSSQGGTQDTSGSDVSSYEDIGKALIQSDYNATKSTADELKLGPVYGSLDEQFNDMIKQQREQKALQEAQLNEQDASNNYQAGQEKNAAEGSTETAVGQLEGNREGFTSATNVNAQDRLKKALSDRLTRLQDSSSVAHMAVEQAKKDLAYAEKSGNTELAKKYRETLDAATAQAEQIDTDYISSLTDQVSAESDAQKTKSAIVQSGVQTFQGIVESGTEMDYSTVKMYADQLGLPVDMLMGYYQGAKSIRDDKTLDTATKKTQLASLNQDLSDQINGISTTQAQNIEYLKKLYKDGADPEIIAAFKSNAGITDYDDPLTQAQLTASTLQNEIDKYEADNLGKPPPEGSPEWLDYQIKKLQLQQAQYQTGEMLGTNQTVSSSQAEEVFQIPGSSKYRSSGWECGEAYNNITDGAKVGDTYTSKLDAARDANGNLRQGLPEVGNGFVIPIGDESIGHVETVISVNPANDSFQTVSWNRNLDGQQTVQTYSLSELQSGSKYGKNWGFTDSTLKPEYQEKLAQNTATSDSAPYSYNSYYNSAVSSGMSSKDAASYAADQYKATQNFQNTDQSGAYTTYNKMAPEESAYDQITKDMTDAQLEDFANNNGYIASKLISLDPDKKLTATIINENFSDPTQRQLLGIQQRWIESKLRKESGAAISVGEYLAEAQNFWPQAGDDAATIKAKEDARKNAMQGFYETSGLHGQKLIDEMQQSSSETIDPTGVVDSVVDPDTYSVGNKYGLQ